MIGIHAAILEREQRSNVAHDQVGIVLELHLDVALLQPRQAKWLAHAHLQVDPLHSLETCRQPVRVSQTHRHHKHVRATGEKSGTGLAGLERFRGTAATFWRNADNPASFEDRQGCPERSAVTFPAPEPYRPGSFHQQPVAEVDAVVGGGKPRHVRTAEQTKNQGRVKIADVIEHEQAWTLDRDIFQSGDLAGGQKEKKGIGDETEGAYSRILGGRTG